MKNFVTLLKIVAIFAVLGFLVWVVTRLDGCGPDTILPTTPEIPIVAVPPPPIFPPDEVTVVRPDSTVDRVRVNNPSEVEETVAVGDSTVIAVLRPKNSWFPDIKRKQTRIRIIEGDNTRIVTTLQPAPLLEFSPRLSAGANFSLNAIQPSLGLELAKIWILRTGVNVSYNTVTKQLDLGPETGVMLRDNLLLTGGYGLNTGQVFLSLKYRF